MRDVFFFVWCGGFSRTTECRGRHHLQVLVVVVVVRTRPNGAASASPITPSRTYRWRLLHHPPACSATDAGAVADGSRWTRSIWESPGNRTGGTIPAEIPSGAPTIARTVAAPAGESSGTSIRSRVGKNRSAVAFPTEQSAINVVCARRTVPRNLDRPAGALYTDMIYVWRVMGPEHLQLSRVCQETMRQECQTVCRTLDARAAIGLR